MSIAKFNTWQNPDGTENYKCRAWVNFNGTGTVAIRAAGNVSSITDNGAGDYTANFTTALPDANYAAFVLCGTGDATLQGNGPSAGGSTTTSSRMKNDVGGTGVDRAVVCVAIFR